MNIVPWFALGYFINKIEIVMQMCMQLLVSSLISFEVDVLNVNLISRILNLLRQAGDPHLIGNLLRVIFI